ncbi:PREDICTED: uncharacterized protein LOC105364690 [Ceratosolen solmsi marchali]|uniref:Uncharacterized protein LOC105364690 n=1 Tax=Ceratosolen solmsi marchali TaxID=326594 RepID=A0AAJ7DYE8_9HYME|nr:PREDICTED: uncharacterized protein LOC105364690 [Ceratosolen solmsi marchali]
MAWLPAIAITSFGFLVISSATWIEIPQFSDQRKIYKDPVSHGFVFKEFNELLTINDANGELTTTIDSMEPEIISLSTNSSNSSQYLNEHIDKELLHYLPINLFKQVHKTLQSQPPTLKGKIRFLKVFEHALLNKIGTRLNAVLTPSRISRETRDHYDIDDRDEKIGFPSLEGALMAISFLTFAVYLIRLVMMLFKHAGTIGIAPIIIGRKKRSNDDVNEERIRILSYLD